MILGSFPNRCGYSQRLPMLVISPWTRTYYVSGKLTNTGFGWPARGPRTMKP